MAIARDMMTAARDTPTLLSSAYASTAYDGANALSGNHVISSDSAYLNEFTQSYVEQIIRAENQKKVLLGTSILEQEGEFQVTVNVNRRMVQVLIVDPNPNIPLDNCLLYKDEPRVTDLTDQELFFSIDIKTILEEHNKKRTQIINKSVKDRTEYLEAAKIRDLKMVVVTIASF